MLSQPQVSLKDEENKKFAVHGKLLRSFVFRHGVEREKRLAKFLGF